MTAELKSNTKTVDLKIKRKMKLFKTEITAVVLTLEPHPMSSLLD